LRANTITILLLILAAALAACSSGKTPQPAENACPTQIIDDTYTGSYRAVLGFGEGAQAALRLAFARPGRFNVVAALDGPVDACRLLADFEPGADRLLARPAGRVRQSAIRRLQQRVLSARPRRRQFFAL
jgi:hypothetical protein